MNSVEGELGSRAGRFLLPGSFTWEKVTAGSLQEAPRLPQGSAKYLETLEFR